MVHIEVRVCVKTLVFVCLGMLGSSLRVTERLLIAVLCQWNVFKPDGCSFLHL